MAKVLSERPRIHVLPLWGVLIHSLFVSLVAGLVASSIASHEPEGEALWILCALVDLPIVLLGRLIVPFVSEWAQTAWDGVPHANIVNPWMFFMVAGGAQYYLLLLLVARWNVSRTLKRRRRLSQCVRCGYDLRGSPGGSCSECGEPILPLQVSDRRDRKRG